MIPSFPMAVFNAVPPRAILNNGSYTCNVIDTLGADYLIVDVVVGATDIAMTALKLQESDTKASATSLTSGADITGAIFGTSNNDTGSASTLPVDTDDNHVFSFFVDLRGRKRYILPVITWGNGSTGGFVTVLARLARVQLQPRTAAAAGYTQRLMI